MTEKKKGNVLPTLRIAFIRAAESHQPAQKRLFEDSFSRRLLPGVWKLFLLPGLRQAMIGMTEKVGPGVIGSLYCRTRFIDDALHAALENGPIQVVILGAGFDARPYRMNGLEKTPVFEIDLPGIIDFKKTRVEQALGKLPDHVSFVPVDFEKQDIVTELTAAGFRKDVRSFFVWEGVTQYLTAEAVDRTFELMHSLAAEDSRVVFTYILQGVIDGSARSQADEKIISFAAKSGNPWIFGISRSEINGYLKKRSLALIDEAGATEFRERYLEPSGRRINILECERIALAKRI